MDQSHANPVAAAMQTDSNNADGDNGPSAYHEMTDAAANTPIGDRQADRYGDQYVGIALHNPAGRGELVCCYGDRVATTSDGALLVTRIDGTVNFAAAAGVWRCAFGISRRDGLPAAIEHWRTW
jgi:hypothetical protein